MSKFESYRIYLKQILTETSIITEFEFDGRVHTTIKETKKALANLRKYITEGSWTNNRYQRFVILNMYRTSEEIASLYKDKTYKPSSTRTIRTRGIQKLMSIIPCEYLRSFVASSGNPKEDYELQIKACMYIHYIANTNISMQDFSDDYNKLFEFVSDVAKPCKVSECEKELNFIAHYYLGYSRFFKKLDIGKLLYINSILKDGMSVGIDEDAALILTTLVTKIKKQYISMIEER